MQVNLSYSNMKLATFVFQLSEESPNIYIFSFLHILLYFFFWQFFVKQKFVMSCNDIITKQVFEFRYQMLLIFILERKLWFYIQF